jgi:membrane-associated phospholipid phosphatase
VTRVAAVTRPTAAYLIGAVGLFAMSFGLGAIVSHTAPSPFDVSELGQYGVATPLARVLTNAGRFPAYFALCVVTLIFAAFRRRWLGRVAVAVIGLVVVWQTSDVFKVFAHRMRPPHPLAPETSFSYPSGHADLALFFYGLWAFFIWDTSLSKPVRISAVGLAMVWIVAIGWSRLALGAHYPSDVIGGYLYGAAWLSLAVAVTYRFLALRVPQARI